MINKQMRLSLSIQILKSEETLRDPWDTIKHTRIQTIGLPESEQRVKGA